jgi:peptidoglycan-associated lipoprotein
MNRSLSTLVCIGVPLALVLATGCAHRPKPAPAETTAPAPAPTPTPTPTPAVTPPAPPPAPSSALRAEDLAPVFFEFDSAALTAPGRAVLDANAKMLRDHSGSKVVIEGHCDERGTTEYNQALGEKRAQAARDYLAAAGVDAARLQTISYGKERPFDSGHDESAWGKNRRAHFTLKP